MQMRSKCQWRNWKTKTQDEEQIRKKNNKKIEDLQGWGKRQNLDPNATEM